MLNPYRRRAPLTPDSAANRFLWGCDDTTLSLGNGPRSTLGAVARRARRGRAAGRLWGVTRGTSVARRRPSGDGPGRLSRGPRALAHRDEAGAQFRTGAACSGRGGRGPRRVRGGTRGLSARREAVTLDGDPAPPRRDGRPDGADGVGDPVARWSLRLVARACVVRARGRPHVLRGLRSEALDERLRSFDPVPPRVLPNWACLLPRLA